MSADPREDRREGIQKAARRLVESGHYKTQTEAESRVVRAVKVGQQKQED